jgi:hypothetical protein
MLSPVRRQETIELRAAVDLVRRPSASRKDCDPTLGRRANHEQTGETAMSPTRTAAVAAAALAALALSLAAFAQMRTVTGVGIVAKPRSYHGDCPATIEWIATIHVSHHPVRVTYQWERSDGAHGPRQEVEIDSAGRGVSDTWQLGGPGMHKVVWQRLHVLAPTGITSREERVKIECRR